LLKGTGRDTTWIHFLLSSAFPLEPNGDMEGWQRSEADNQIAHAEPQVLSYMSRIMP